MQFFYQTLISLSIAPYQQFCAVGNGILEPEIQNLTSPSLQVKVGHPLGNITADGSADFPEAQIPLNYITKKSSEISRLHIDFYCRLPELKPTIRVTSWWRA